MDSLAELSAPVHNISFPDAVKRGMLASASETAGYLAGPGKQERHGFWTRTVGAYFKAGGKWHVAVDDVADARENILLSRAQEGYAAYDEEGAWMLPRTDRHVQGLLERAIASSRVVSLDDDRIAGIFIYEGKLSFDRNSLLLAALEGAAAEYPLELRANHGRYTRWHTRTAAELDRLSIGTLVLVEVVCFGHLLDQSETGAVFTRKLTGESSALYK